MGKKKPKPGRKKPPRHTVSEGEVNIVSGSRDESTSKVQNDSPEARNDLCLKQSGHDSSECEGNSEEEQDTDAPNSDSFKMNLQNIVVDDESTDEESIPYSRLLYLKRAGEAVIKQLKAKVTGHEIEIRRLKNINKQDSKELKLIHDSKESLNKQNSDLQNRLWSLEEKNEKLIAEAKVVSDLRVENWTLRQDSDSATQQIQNLTYELRTMTKLREDQEDSKKWENMEHKKEKEKLNQRLSGLEKQKKELELEKVEATSKIEQLSIDNQQMKEEISRLERSLEEEKEKLIAEAKVVSGVQEERIQNLTNKLETMTKLKKDQEDSRKRENMEQENEKDKLNSKLSGLEKQKKDLELEKVEAMSKIEQLSISNQQMKEEILRLEQSHQASNIEETEVLLNKLAVTIPIDKDISEKLKKAEEELDDLKQDMKLKREEIDKLRCEKVAALTCKLDALNNEIQRITKERDMLEGSNVQLRAANEGLKQVVESKDAKIEELKVKTREYVNYERWRMSNVVGMLEGKVFAWMNNMSSINNEGAAFLVELQGRRQHFATPSGDPF